MDTLNPARRVTVLTRLAYRLTSAVRITFLATCGSCFLAAQTATFTAIYNFKAGTDGGDSQAGLVIGADGAMYGTTEAGGTSGQGTVFQLKPSSGNAWSENVLCSFSGSSGAYPKSSLVIGPDGTLYGTTKGGGNEGGVVFQLQRSTSGGDVWVESVLYAFPEFRTQFSTPNGLTMGPSGVLFTTTEGQALESSRQGGLVALTPPSAPDGTWQTSYLYMFPVFGSNLGLFPYAAPTYNAGAVFGATVWGGNDACFSVGCGVVYELTPPTPGPGAWTETSLHVFAGFPNDGASPAAPLTPGAEGVLYGTTQYGGSGNCVGEGFQGCGTIFELMPPADPGGAWTETVIYSFSTNSKDDGAFPIAGVVVGTHGQLFGTTSGGGTSGRGTVFQLSPPTTVGGAWTEQILHSFSGSNGDGATPAGGVVLSSTGVLYGTTSAGGTAGKGLVFSIVP